MVKISIDLQMITYQVTQIYLPFTQIKLLILSHYNFLVMKK